MVVLHTGIIANPLISELHSLGAAGKHPSHKGRAERRVRFFAFSIVDQFLDKCDIFFQIRPNAGRAADRGTGEVCAVTRHVLSCNEGTHTVAEHKVRQTRIHLYDKIVESLLIFHHRRKTLTTPIAPAVVLDGGLSMADMVISSHDITGFHKTGDHMKVSAGMLTESMDQLNDSKRFAGGNIDPSIDLIAFIEGIKFDFM